MLNNPSFFRTLTKWKLVVFKASLIDIDKANEAKSHPERLLEEIVPTKNHEFLPFFGQVSADRLPPHRPGINHEVCLKDGEAPTGGPLDLMSRTELVTLKGWLEENMSQGFIHQSSSPFAMPVLYEKKPDGGL